MANVYIDATSSMAGFAAPTQSRYLRFIRDLEAAVATGWSEDSIAFYKFGTIVREIPREDFLEVSLAQFYAEPGMFERTKIDSVIARVDRGTLSIVITDLFQDNRDTNLLVSTIKDQVLSRGVEVGLLAIESEFDGTVYDANVGSYRYSSLKDSVDTYRPFYALMFGNQQNITRMIESLSTNAYVNGDFATIIPGHLIEDYDVVLEKRDRQRDLNIRGRDERLDSFTLRASGDGEGRLQLSVGLEYRDYMPPVNVSGVDVVARRKAAGEAPSEDEGSGAPSGSELSLEGVDLQDGRLLGTLRLNLTDLPAGTHIYKALLELDSPDALGVPPWVPRFSSDNPSPSSAPNKTLNLERFVSGLLQASVAVDPPELTKFFLIVERTK